MIKGFSFLRDRGGLSDGKGAKKISKVTKFTTFAKNLEALILPERRIAKRKTWMKLRRRTSTPNERLIL
jgi:hypothetical protein